MSSPLKQGHIVPVNGSAGATSSPVGPKSCAMSTTTALTTPPPNRRDRGILRSLVVMFVACSGLVVFTVVLGIQANSMALISDAMLMATDAVTYVVAIGMEVGGLKVRGRRRINDRCGARINLAILLGANTYIMVDASRALYAAAQAQRAAADAGGGGSQATPTVAAPEEVDGVTMMWATSLNLVVDVLVYIGYRRMISEQTKRRVAARAGSLPAGDEPACLESEDEATGGADLKAGGRAVVDGMFDGMASDDLLGIPLASSSSPLASSPLAAATATSPLQPPTEAPPSPPPSSRCNAGMSRACQSGARTTEPAGVSGNGMDQSICSNSLHAQVAAEDDDDEEDSREELNLKSALAHLFADGLRSVGVLVSGALIALELAPGEVTDAACSLFITLFIIAAVAGLTRKAFSLRWSDIKREAQVLRGRRRDDGVQGQLPREGGFVLPTVRSVGAASEARSV